MNARSTEGVIRPRPPLSRPRSECPTGGGAHGDSSSERDPEFLSSARRPPRGMRVFGGRVGNPFNRKGDSRADSFPPHRFRTHGANAPADGTRSPIRPWNKTRGSARPRDDPCAARALPTGVSGPVQPKG